MVEPEVSVQPDGLFAVSMRVNMEAVNGNYTMPKDSKSPDNTPSLGYKVVLYWSSLPASGPGNKSVICQMEVPDQHLISEKMISITGEPHQTEG